MSRIGLHDRIDGCLDDVAVMLGIVESAVADVTVALVDGDTRTADRVIRGDRRVNEIYERVDARCLEIIARQAPLAGDLRALMAVVRMIGDVERAGDLALTLAKVVHRTAAYALPPAVSALVRALGHQATSLLGAAAAALRDLEPDSAERLDLVDDVLDELAERMLGTLEDEPSVPTALAMQMAVAARCYERIGDHAVGVSERVEFLVTGAAHSAHVGL